MSLLRRRRVAALGGVCTTTSCALTPWVVTRAPIATVAVLRLA